VFFICRRRGLGGKERGRGRLPLFDVDLFQSPALALGKVGEMDHAFFVDILVDVGMGQRGERSEKRRQGRENYEGSASFHGDPFPEQDLEPQISVFQIVLKITKKTVIVNEILGNRVRTRDLYAFF
jgi:hypothetical protein